jgi:hypothetical protein
MVGAMLLSNAVLLLCIVGLGVTAVGGGRLLGMFRLAADVNQQIARDYVARTLHNDPYRICACFPAKPLEGNFTTADGNKWQVVREKGAAQRLKLQLLGPKVVMPLDVVCWIQGGKVTRAVAADYFRFADESVPEWQQRRLASAGPGQSALPVRIAAR